MLSARLRLLSTILALSVVGAPLAAQAAPAVYFACYVPLTGTVYRIKESGLKPSCTAGHIEFSWTDGAGAVRTTDPLGGDLSGALSNASVVKLLGRALSTTPPTLGQALAWNGTSWTPTTLGGGGGVTSHAALTGLSADDHPQYLLANGTRPAANGFAVSGDLGTGAIPTSGPGTRLMWYPGKAAFRAGRAFSSQWDDANIGEYSTGLGWSTTASGRGSVALGGATTASGISSTAMGFFASTNSFDGSFVYGDASVSQFVTATAINQFTVRAAGGFRFRTAADLSTGCDITNGNLSCTGSITGAGSGSPIDHGVLTGLADDDHAQYLLADGVRASTNGFAVAGTRGTGAIPASGAGTRLMWYPGKAAFRVGTVHSTLWNDDNVGLNSIAIGEDTYAPARGAIALGTTTRATGQNSTALGRETTASGRFSTAMGLNASTNAQDGSFVYGDASTADIGSILTATSHNQFAVRAAGGFRFRTASDLGTGCDLPAGSGTWSCTSSRLAKERFENLNGEDVLTKIARMPIQSWSYRTEAGGVRHVGPTAQDFRAAFGLGDSDQAISLVDIDGINLLGVQTLERRTAAQAREMQTLRAENAELRARLERLEVALKRFENR